MTYWHQPFLYFSIFLALLLSGCSAEYSGKKLPEAVKGTLDLQNWDFEKDGPVALSGEWEMYWEQILDGTEKELDTSILPDGMVDIPFLFSTYVFPDGRELQRWGYGTFRLKVLMPHPPASSNGILKLYSAKVLSASALTILDPQGQALGPAIHTGRVGRTAEESIPLLRFATASFPYANEWTVFWQVSNFDFFEGGILRSPLLGDVSQIDNRLLSQFSIDFIIIGLLLLMGFYHLTLFFLYREDRAPLWFGMVCLQFAISAAHNGAYLEYAFPYWPFFDYGLYYQINSMILYATIPMGVLFFQSMFPKQSHPWIVSALVTMGSVFSILVLLVPLELVFHSHIRTTFIGFQVLFLFWVIYILIRASFFEKSLQAQVLFIGFVCLFFIAMHDVLGNLDIISTTSEWLFFGMGLLMFFQAISLAIKNRNTIQEKFQAQQVSIESLTEMNQSIARFVPPHFLQFLDKTSILDIQLGDHVQKEMSILFSDIRSFTKLSEKITPQETFRFINSYLSQMGPLVEKHQGYIDKYIGDAIMALFPKEADDAVESAISMVRLLDDYNAGRQKAHYVPIEIGIGINSGTLMLGAVGEHNRIEGTVISDAVNLTARIESLTKVYGVPILISDHTLTRLTNPAQYKIRFIDKVQVKGKEEWVVIHEVFDGDPPEVQQKKQETFPLFREAWQLFQEQSFQKAEALFQQCAAHHPTDPVIQVYLERCRSKIKLG